GPQRRREVDAAGGAVPPGCAAARRGRGRRRGARLPTPRIPVRGRHRGRGARRLRSRPRAGGGDALTARTRRATGGEPVRPLALGAMLPAHRPVLLADEPGYGLDRAAARTVHTQLREAARDGHGVVVATHDLRTVEAADEVVVLSEGRVHGPMSPATLLQDHDLLRRAGLRADPEGAVPAPASPSAVAAEPRIRERPWLARRNPTVLLGLLTALSIACIALTDPAPL